MARNHGKQGGFSRREFFKGAAAGVAAMVLTDPKKKKALIRAAKDMEKKAAVGLDKLSKGAVNLQKRINQELKAVKGK